MEGHRWKTGCILACLLASLLGAPASAAAGDVALGIDQGAADESRALGAPPRLVSFWVGEWMARSGWSGLENALRGAKADGATPVVYWYYWGDHISPSCVDWGCSDRSRSEWDSMTATLASKIRAIMGGATTYVVLENEFNKNGIQASNYAWKFDGHLEAKAHALKAVPGVKVVLGLGGWGEGEWGRFPKAIAASDVIGFQVMRASTRDSEATYRGAADRIASLIASARGVSSGKPTLLYDLALSSYPDAHWARVQDETLGAILARRAEFAASGLQGIVYRELRDNPSMGTWNYYGTAEQHWGFRTKDGAAKPAWTTWMRAHGGAGPFAPTFSTDGGNEWWIAVKVASDSPVSGVCASVDGGACRPLQRQWWGDWAASFHVPHGARVAFTATSASGAKATSGAYEWPSGRAALDVQFRPSGNEWWVQSDLTASARVTAVCASIDGGACQALDKQSWGGWAKSLRAPSGSHVRFRATADGGQTAWSAPVAWPPR